MTRSLNQPYRAFLRTAEVLIRLGVMPPPTELRQTVAQRQAVKPPRWMTRPGDPTVQTREVMIDSRGGPMRIRLYVPADVRPDQPAILYMHGGGFVLGGLDACHYITQGLASRTGLVVASVEYRLAPECPHPGPLDDCEDALRWLVETAPEDCDVARVGVAGDSAGGNLAAALALRMRDVQGPHIAHQTLIYPFLDATITAGAWSTFEAAGVGPDAGHQMKAWYAPDHEATDPAVSPLHAPDLGGLPRALVITAGFDVLRDDGLAYVDRLRDAGVPTAHRDFAAVPHGFLAMPRMSTEPDRAIDLMAREISIALWATTVS